MCAERLRVELAVIPPPAEGTRSVMVQTGPSPVCFKSDGPVDGVCGNCGAVLVESGHLHMVQNVVLRCRDCGAHNESSI
jgi:hypothetical protein